MRKEATCGKLQAVDRPYSEQGSGTSLLLHSTLQAYLVHGQHALNDHTWAPD